MWGFAELNFFTICLLESKGKKYLSRTRTRTSLKTIFKGGFKSEDTGSLQHNIPNHYPEQKI